MIKTRNLKLYPLISKKCKILREFSYWFKLGNQAGHSLFIGKPFPEYGTHVLDGPLDIICLRFWNV